MTWLWPAPVAAGLGATAMAAMSLGRGSDTGDEPQ